MSSKQVRNIRNIFTNEKVKETAGNAVKEKASNAYSATKQAASKIGETIVETGKLVKDKTFDAIQATKEASVKAKDTVAEKIENFAHSGKKI